MRSTSKAISAGDVWEANVLVRNIASAVTLTSGAGAKGSYVQLTASLNDDVYGFIIALADKAGAGVTDVFVDLAWGAAAAEVNFIADLTLNLAAAADGTVTYYIPHYKVKGTRISARCGTVGGATVEINCWVIEK